MQQMKRMITFLFSFLLLTASAFAEVSSVESQNADAFGFVFGLFGILFSLIWLVFFGAMIAAMVFWILMIVDVVKRDFPKQDDKTVWILIVILAGIIGAIIYYFMIKRKDQK